MIRKRLIAYSTSLALLFTTVFCGLSVPVNAASTDDSAPLKVIEDDTVFVRDSETGNISIIESDKPAAAAPGKKKTSSTLPSYYGDYQDIKNKYPNTRNQNPYGTCWAHAATACAEFDLVKNHGASKNTADYSELQLAYLHYNTGRELPGLDGDQIYIPSSAPRNYLDVGGNIYYSMQTLAQWKCFTHESNVPYSTVVSNPNYNVWSKLSGLSNNSLHNAAQLRNVRMLDIKNNPAAVKKAIMDYGAVYISYNHNSNYYSLNDYSLYYNPNKTGTNHDVAIVGWYDGLPRTKFPANNRPSSNGGWLVRNSWSTDQSIGSEYTYFYISYQDATISSSAYALDFEPYNSDDNIYQHDGSTTHSYVYTNSAANVFTANSTMDSNSERLDSVMLSFIYSENVKFKVDVYTGLTSSAPKSGKLVSSTTGSTTSPGIYTVDLKTPVYLVPGQKYSIVVSTTNGGKTYFDIENSSQTKYLQNGKEVAWFTTVASADKGESFIYDNGAWIDVTTYGYGNLCIKAITSDNSYKLYTIKYNLNGGKNSSSNPASFSSTQSGSFTLKNPSRSGYHFTGWYSDAALTNKVTSINYNNKSDQTFYAGWCSNNSISSPSVKVKATQTSNGSYSGRCTECGTVLSNLVSYKASSVKLSTSKPLYTGSKRSPVPVIKTSNGETLKSGTDYTYVYNQKNRTAVGRYSVTVKFKNRYSGSKTLWFTVVPKAPSTASAKLYGYNDVQVSWSKSTGASGYYVYYKKASASTYKSYKRTANRYVKLENLSSNTKYTFKIIPYYKRGDVRYTSTKAKVVTATTLKKLKQPSIYANSDGSVALNWECISAASGYQVYWAYTKTGKYYKLCDYSSTYTGITFNVGYNETYWYKTRAYRIVGSKRIYGPWSDPKSFTLR